MKTFLSTKGQGALTHAVSSPIHPSTESLQRAEDAFQGYIEIQPPHDNFHKSHRMPQTWKTCQRRSLIITVVFPWPYLSLSTFLEVHTCPGARIVKHLQKDQHESGLLLSVKDPKEVLVSARRKTRAGHDEFHTREAWWPWKLHGCPLRSLMRG